MSIYTSPAMTTICEHLRFEGHPASFVISGGGGAEFFDWTPPPQARGPWGLRPLGVTDLQMSKENLVVRYIGKDASILYEFKRPVSNMERS
jgi:hypothetical protein